MNTPETLGPQGKQRTFENQHQKVSNIYDPWCVLTIMRLPGMGKRLHLLLQDQVWYARGQRGMAERALDSGEMPGIKILDEYQIGVITHYKTGRDRPVNQMYRLETRYK